MADFSTVLNQCNDLLHLYQQLVDRNIMELKGRKSSSLEVNSIYRELEIERLKHQETKTLLAEEVKKLHLLDSELKVLQRQLSREKSTFETAFGMLQTKDFSIHHTPKQLITKLTALEAINKQKDKELEHKEKVIQNLQRKMKLMKDTHQREVEDLKLILEQKLYLSQTRKK